MKENKTGTVQEEAAVGYAEAQRNRVKPLAVEPFDKVWGIGISGNTPDPSPFPRINRILNDTPRSTNGEVDPTRALKLTEAYQKHESDPHIVQVAWGLYEHYTTSPIEIFPDELLVGTLGAPKKAGPVFPEYGVDWIVDEMKNGLMDYSEQRTHDYFWYSDETIRKLEAIQPYWHGKSVADVATACLTDEEYGMTETGLAGAVGCTLGGGYHPWSSDLYYEVVDPETGAVLPDGQEGELTVTTLGRRGMPLIRYRTGDISRILPGPCPCGSVLPHMARVGDRHCEKKYQRVSPDDITGF